MKSTIAEAVAELKETINSTLADMKAERALIATKLEQLDKGIAALEKLTPPPPRAKRKYQRRKDRKAHKIPAPRVPKEEGEAVLPKTHLSQCGRGDCTHLESQHNKGPDKKCSAVGCWCYGFVRRAA
jgi:hypothetical protein